MNTVFYTEVGISRANIAEADRTGVPGPTVVVGDPSSIDVV